MKFGYTLLYVEDVDQTLRFYETAFGFQRKFYSKEGDQEYGELLSGETTIGFASHPLASSHGFDYTMHSLETKPPAMELGMVTEDVQAGYDQAVAAGAVEVASPSAKPWGQVVSYVRDPNGFLIEICSPMGGAEA